MRIKIEFLLASLVFLTAASCSRTEEKVWLGVDVFMESAWADFKGKTAGLITNATGVNSELVSTIDILHQNENIRLAALFSPEHGIRGDIDAGGVVHDQIDSRTGLPVYSLYGNTRMPAPEMLKGIDVLIYDIQDIGNRTYTYIYTMAYAMQAAAKHNIQFVVFDRPNAMNANLVDGNVLDPEFSSFIGLYPIAYVYGMTPGELAMYFNKEFNINADLTVIPMRGYRRDMEFAETGLFWVPTSPHIPRAETAYHCAATGSLGELHTVCVGIGYTLPFELAGETWIDSNELADNLNARDLPGVLFRPTVFTPYYSVFKDKSCAGVQLIIDDTKSFLPFTTQIHILEALQTLYPESRFLENQRRVRSFHRATGTDQIRKALLEGKKAEEIIRSYQDDLEAFKKRRLLYLIYN